MKRTPIRRKPSTTRAWFRRTQATLRVKAWTARRKPLPRLSAKHAAELREYAKQRKVFLAEHPVCESCWAEPAVEVHHTRGKMGQLLLDVRFWLPVGWLCHGIIEREREAGHRSGELRSRHTGDAKGETWNAK